MKWNKLYTYPKSVRSVIQNERHYSVAEENLPSVTTILKATESEEKKQSLARWIAKKGEKEAERVKNEAARRGTAMHKYLELYIEGQGILDLTEIGREAERMAKTVIDKGFSDMEEIWGSECVLAYPGLYAGQTDLCGIYQGRESIIDFKQSNKPKKDEWIEDYKLQGAAYAMAHDDMFGTDIEQIVILMCTPDCFFQRFIINGKRFKEYKYKWLERVDKYYGNKKLDERM